MKKVFVIISLLITISFINTNNVLANEIFYVNKNNVEFSKEEYEFLSFMFWDGCQELFTQDDYENFIKSDIMDGEIKISTNEGIMPLSTIYEQQDRTLKIVSSCTTNCVVSVTLTWKNIPAIKSYDVMGAYLENTALLNTPTTTVTSSNETYMQTFTNGFGVSIKLPNINSTITINQNFKVNKSGNVYASYQHAMRAISLENSKNYTLSKQGYGKVFKFSGSAISTYDQMTGVEISL